MPKQYLVDNLITHSSYVVLTLKPRSQADQIAFWPGQYATLSVRRGKSWWPVRCLSFTNAPDNSGRLEFAFRVTGHFTQSLARLKTGDQVRIQGPFGEFTLSQAAQNPIFIAGGIGITPFMSMIRTAAEHTEPFDATLLYAAGSESELVYFDELLLLAKKLPGLRIYTFLSNPPKDNDHFLPGPINSTYLSELVAGQAHEFDYYLCGPDGMMKSLSKQLIKLGADKDYIFTESFSASSKGSSEGLTLNPTKIAYVLAFGMFLVLASAIAVQDVSRKVALAQPKITTNTTQTTTRPTTQTPRQTSSTPQTTDPYSNPSQSTTPSSNYTQQYQQPVSSVS